MKRRTDNLIPMYDRFNESDLVFLLAHLRDQGEERLHAGILPFLERNIAVQAMVYIVNNNNNEKTSRKAMKLLEKLGHVNDAGLEEFFMYLDSTKLCRVFGKPLNNVKEFKLPFVSEVTCGIQWQHFKGSYDKVKSQVYEYIRLEWQQGDLWKVTVRDKLAQKTKEYLHEKYPSIAA